MGWQDSRLKRIGIVCLLAASAWIGWRAWSTNPFASSQRDAIRGLHVPEQLDFPPVPLGGTIEKTLEIKNGPDQEVTIYQVEAACGCTQVKSKQVTLRRNETVQFPVIMHGWTYTAMAGDKTLQIRTSIGTYDVKVHTQGIAGLGVSPTVLDFGRTTSDTLPVTLEYSLFAESLTAEQRQSLRATSPHPGVEVGPIRFDGQGTGRVSVTLGRTPIFGLIWSDIEFTGTGIDTIRSSVNAQIEGPVIVHPSSLVIHSGTIHKIDVISNSQSDTTILKASASDELASYLKLSTDTPGVVECHLESPVTEAISPVLRGYILIDLKNDTAAFQVSVPVTALLK